MRQVSTNDQMTQKLTTIGHRTTFNNEKSPYRLVSYKRSQNNNSNEKTNGLTYVQNKNNYVTHKQTTTTELQAPD